MGNRQQEIVELVNIAGEMTVAELHKAFPDVSEVTLRKDLKYLNSTMQLVRVHGGAKSLPAAIGSVDNFYTRSSKNTAEKKIIAEKAISLLKPNQSMFIAAGSTCAEFVRMLPDIPLQVFTNGLITAIELSKHQNIEATMIGGTIDTDIRCVGPKMYEELRDLHLDYAFLGADSYRNGYGFVCCSSNAEMLFKTARKSANKLVILMDSSKVNANRAPRIIRLTEVDAVITDGKLDSTTLKEFKKSDIEVL